MRTRLATLLSLSLALLLSACALQVNTTLEADQSGVYALEVGFTPADQESLETLDTNVEDFCAEVAQGDNMPKGGTTTVETRGDMEWCILQVPFKNLTELRAIYEEMDGLKVNTLAVENGALVYDLTLTAEGSAGVDLDELEMVWQVTLPGTLGKHNAPEVTGNTLRWEVTAGEPMEIEARSQLGGLAGVSLPSPLMLLAGAGLLLFCCVAVLGAGVVAFVLMRQRKPQPPAV